MAKPLLPDALWDRIRPLLPPPPKPKRPDRPGRNRLDDHKCLIGILLVLKTGIDGEDLPVEMGCGSGMTCWRRLEYWTRCGVWRRRHQLLLAELEYAARIDWSRAAIDSATVRARGGGASTGPSPVDRRKPGSKHFAVTAGDGGRPWRRGRRRRTGRTSRSWSGRPTGSRRCGASEALRDAAPTRRTPIEGSTRGPTVRRCGGAASGHRSRCGASRTAAGWGRSDGSWSGRCRGCITSAACG